MTYKEIMIIKKYFKENKNKTIQELFNELVNKENKNNLEELLWQYLIEKGYVKYVEVK